jgi:hypothetical protein
MRGEVVGLEGFEMPEERSQTITSLISPGILLPIDQKRQSERKRRRERRERREDVALDS